MTEARSIDALKAIAHPVRLRILQALTSGPLNVGEIESGCAIGQPSLSQQLAILRQSGLVRTRRDGKQVYYSLVRSAIDEAAKVITALQPEATGSGTNRSGAKGAANFAILFER